MAENGRHQRSTTLNSSRSRSASHQAPITADLQALLSSLSEAASSNLRPPSLKTLQIQSDDLRKIRAILVVNGPASHAKGAFRHVGGFQLLIQVLRGVSGFYDAPRLSRDGRTEFFGVIKAALDVLSEALNDHPGNRRYFAKRVADGGWKALEEALASTGILTVSSAERNEEDTGQAHLFSYLVAFALGEETVGHMFRSMRKPSESSAGIEQHDRSAAVNTESLRVDDLDKQLRQYLTGLETLNNPEIVPVIVNFSWMLQREHNQNNQGSALATAVALCLKNIFRSSIYNQIAMHRSGVLSNLISIVFTQEAASSTQLILRGLAEELVTYGCSELSDAYALFRKATKSEIAADFVLAAMKSSRSPPFIHFDLSTRGFSSIELPTLGKTFPPTSNSNGYTLAAWIRIEHFDPETHTTIFGAYDSSQTCFVLAYLEKDTRHFILQTSVKSSKPSVRFKSYVFEKGMWYHLAVVHRRPRATSSSRAALFVNGVFFEQIKCQYPSSPPAPKHSVNKSTESFASVTSNQEKHSAVQAFLGTPQDLAVKLDRNVVHSKWSCASFHLWSEALSDELITVIEKLGPRYNGNFQDSLGSFLTYRSSAELNRHNELLHPNQEEKSEILSALHSKTGLLLPEQKLLLSFFPKGVLDSDDTNSINCAQLINLLPKDAARTLQRLLRAGGNSVIVNAAVPSFNEALAVPHGVAVLTGNTVACVPQALDDACWRVAGTAAIGLKLVELSRTRDQVLRAVRIVFSSIEDSWRNSEAMEKENGFGVLAGLLREKLGFGSIFEERAPGRLPSVPVDPSEREELALELLRLCLKFIGYNEENPEESLINNPLAYRSLFVDFDTWRRTPIATQKLYWSQFVQFAGKSRNLKFNTKRLTKMRIIKRFLDALKGESFSVDVFPDFIEAFSALFASNMTPKNLRSLALFITYAFQDTRAFPTHASRLRKTTALSQHSSSALNSERSTPRSLSPGYHIDLGPVLPRYEVGVEVLQMFLNLLHDKTSTRVTEKFAKTVPIKWLLFMLEEPDPRVVFISMRILAIIMFALGPPYVREHFVKGDLNGFVILKHRLKTWWNMPAIWVICFAFLLGQDITRVNFDAEFNHFNLAELFSQKPVKVVHPEMFPVIAAMLEHGLRAIVADTEDGAMSSTPMDRKADTQNNGTTSRRAAEAATIQRLTSDADILQTVVRFLTDLHLKWSNFRDFAVQSSYVQDLLFVLYPIVVTSDSVSAETELHSRGSGLNFEGQDVIIRPHATSENQRPPIVRTSTVDPPPSPSPQRAMPFKRASSFVLITSENGDRLPDHARFNAILSPTNSAPVSLRVGNTIVEGLLQVILGVLLDQILERKEFTGFGLFHKVPPGFQEHQVYFESYILNHAMSSLTNNLRLNPKLLTEPKVLTNIARYALYMADAIFEGWFLNGADALLDFCGTQLEYLQRPEIAKLKNVRLCSQAVVNMRITFLRVALLRLSDLDSVTNEDETIAFLNKMAYWQTIILSTDSSEHSFLRLIFYLLYEKIVSRKTPVRLAAVNLWRNLLVQKSDEAFHVLNKAASEKYRDYLPAGFMRLGQVDNDTFFLWVDKNRDDLDQLFLGSLAKHWEEFVHNENKKTEETANNRLNKRRETLKTWQAQETSAEDHWRKHEVRTAHWRNNVYSAERIKHQRAIQDQQDMLSSMAATVEKMDSTVKGPCQLFESESGPKWRLDEIEGYWRMRMRIVQDKTTLQDDYQPKRKTGDRSKNTAPPRLDVNIRIVPNKEPMHASPVTTIKPELEVGISSESGRQRSNSQATVDSFNRDDDYEVIDDPKEDENGFEDKNRKVMRGIQHGDVIQVVYNVSRIVGLEACEGLLILGKTSLYLMDHFFQRGDGEVVRAWQTPEEERDPYVRMISGKETQTKKPLLMPGERSNRHWRWSAVMLISKRRFLFRDVAIEIFFTDGQSFLLTAISPAVRDDLHSKLSARAPLVRDASAAAVSEDGWRLESVRHPDETPQTFGSKFANVFQSISSNPATKKWMKGEMSNFAYLMLVNTMAGRTFNDLTQYPVFPWVLADYTSEELDLKDPKTFRDLSKPMGCQVPSREAEFRERYQAFTEMGDHNAPPFHYGTHYSSAMIVSSYLIRLQPFVQSYLLLQGGSFDHADRLFYSIEKAWLSASRDNMTDVRELTPEFFFLPEFLVNLNGYNFGARQNSNEIINDVILPPWAKGDPHIFIAKHREALESPYVSLHLHKWIDLIFGFKQRGEAAIEATNVFHHLSYHGARDLDAITDPVERLATIGIIHNFGQTPRQLFPRPHPQREETSLRSKTLESAAEGLRGSSFPLYETPDRINELVWHPKLERVLHTNPFRIFIPPSYDRYLEFGFADATLRFFTSDTKKLVALYENFHLGYINCAAFMDSRTLVTGGADGVVSVWHVSHANKTITLEQRCSLFGHRTPIVALAVAKSFSTLLTADSTGRVLTWDLTRGDFVRELISQENLRGRTHDDEVKQIRIHRESGDIALAIGRRAVKIFSLNGKRLLEADVCDSEDAADELTALQWSDRAKGDWTPRRLLITGHRNGDIKVWSKRVAPGNASSADKWTLELVKRLEHPGPMANVAPIVAMLPMGSSLYAADGDGRVYEWQISKHD